jgi:hypothetical protein
MRYRLIGERTFSQRKNQENPYAGPPLGFLTSSFDRVINRLEAKEALLAPLLLLFIWRRAALQVSNKVSIIVTS